VKNRSSLTMQLFTLSQIKIQINNKTSIKLGLVGYAELLGPRFEALDLRLRQITQTSALIIPRILLDLIQ
jgi:hypothetical protein